MHRRDDGIAEAGHGSPAVATPRTIEFPEPADGRGNGPVRHEGPASA